MSDFRSFIARNGWAKVLLALWGLTLTTLVVIKVFFDPPNIPAGTAAAFATLFALPPLVVKFWQWQRDKAE